MKRAGLLAGALLFLVLFLRTAWVTDDAYITFRTVDNILNGYGPRWNIVNRVQAFTHPLWMLVMTAAAGITGDVYYTSMLLSIACSLAAVLLVGFRLAGSTPMAILALSALGLSKAFVDYSTSGLENALTHLLLALFFVARAGDRGWTSVGTRRLFVLSLLAACIMLNRFDAGLLVLPVLAVEAWQTRQSRIGRYADRQVLVALAAGMLPFLAWEVFSLVYYGFPFPNTAYSKLKTGIPRADLVHQGLLYLLDSLHNDPVTLAVILAALVSPFVVRRDRAVPVGIALYVFYVVWVGGDFMSGRFLAAPFFCAVVHLSRMEIREPGIGWAIAMALVWMAGLATSPQPTFRTTAEYGADIEHADLIAPTGITDERRFYYPQSGLLTARRGVPMPNHKWIDMGHDLAANDARLFSTDAAGFIGYAAGPTVHFIDKYGLGDPLMARLPAEVPWRIGHFLRRVPDGYEETLQSGRNMIHDTAVAEYYERLRTITEGPIWSARRFRTIFHMNVGRYETLISSYGLVRLPLEAVAQPGEIAMTLRGVEIALPAPARARRVELSVSRNDCYRVLFMEAERRVAERSLEQPLRADGGLTSHVIDAPDRQFDRIRVLPEGGGDSIYRLGYLRLVP